MNEARAARLRGLLPEGAGAISCAVANVRWLTGIAGAPHELYGMAPLWVVLGPAGVRIVAPASELAWLDEAIGLERVIAHGRFVLRGNPSRELARAVDGGADLGEALERALVDVEADGPTVIDASGSIGALQQVAGELANRQPVVTSEPWLLARAVKDEQEIAALRRVNRVAETALATALMHADVGVSEHELLRLVRETMVSFGARPLLGSVGIGERGALVDFTTSGRTLGPGEPIRLDVGCTLDGYHADLARTAVLGEPPAWLTLAHGAVLAGERAAVSALRPDVSGAELFEIAVQATREAGLPDYERGHCGHGIGLDMYELPGVRPGAEAPMQAGMTCCLETPLYEIGRGGVQVEDALVVTATGCERLGRLPEGLLAAGEPLPTAKE